MTFLSARRLTLACTVSVASLAALMAPGVASALPKTDKGARCSGSNIEGLGSTFQAPAQEVWTGLKSPAKGFDESNGVKVGCGTSSTKPTVVYNQSSSAVKGSGACLKDYGAGATPKFKEFPFCGTDEAPNPTVKSEMEIHAKSEPGYEGDALETIPIAQGAEAIIVHLPAACVAESEPEKAGVLVAKLGRLVLDHTTLEGIYRGTIKTWQEVVAAQGAGHGTDKVTCKGGTESTTAHPIKYIEGGVEKELLAGEKATAEQEEEEIIRPVVRLDKSGTTHIFKEYLGQVNTGEWEAEEFNEPEGGSTPKCGVIKPLNEKVTWNRVAEGCENQRWPTAANVLRPALGETGNGGVVKLVNATESSVGYADLAFARNEGFFSNKCETGKKAPLCSGENKKGTKTVVGEQNTRFWVELQDTEPGTTPVYADPASNGDVQARANSNCASTIYIAKTGEKFPPKSTRETWFATKAQLKQSHYSICGLTYDLALRQYYYFLSPEGVSEANSINIATTTGNYLEYVLNTETEGGGKELKNHDYESLPANVLKEAKLGAEEIGSKEG